MTEFNRWLKLATEDPDLISELNSMTEVEKAEAFSADLTFGTGGLRGLLGAGTNRMNIYTTAKASQGLANYIRDNFAQAERKVAVSFDSRIKSELFSQIAAGVFAANGIQVYIYPRLMPTPCLSYAVRELNCAAGVMITASHNPAQYNGYKVYGPDGCQITTAAAELIFNQIEKVDIFEDVRSISFSEGLKCGSISFISEAVVTSFVNAVKRESVLFGDKTDKTVSIVYSPLNGTGLEPVVRTLRESGFTNITVVEEQAEPDGYFPTCPSPNPEIREAMALGMEYARKHGADILLATDPDCDRIGIAVRTVDGTYQLLSGNETGILLLDFICAQRTQHGKMPKNPVFIKTIVTIDMARRIAASYGVKTIDVLTGFKFIGEQIGKLEKHEEQKDSYVFGFEESYGYLSGSYVRDKDAVDGALLICEMFAFYKTRGISLPNKLEQLQRTYGYCVNTLFSYSFEGITGFVQMKQIMALLRSGVESIGGQKVLKLLDYAPGRDGLPKSDVLKFALECGSIVVRPSGTEPKLKLYVSVQAESKERAQTMTDTIQNSFFEVYIQSK